MASKASDRFKSSDASIGEKLAALGVSGVMSTKSKLGMGLLRRPRKYRRSPKKGKGMNFNEAVRRAHKGIIGANSSNLHKVSKIALSSIKKAKKKVNEPKKRILPIPKSGGFLPLIPLFAALGALGSIGGGAAGIAKAVNDAKAAKQQLEEQKRHNLAMEGQAVGNGLYLKPYKQGFGLYLAPYKKNFQ